MTNPATQELAKLLGSRLIERRDAKAQQFPNGDYMPVRVDPKNTESDLIPWRLSDIVQHVEGRKSFGHYLVSTAGTCRTFAFDIDLRKRANPARDEPPIVFDGVEIDPREVWAGPNCPARLHLARLMFGMGCLLGQQIRDLLDVPVLLSYSGSKGMHVYALLDPETPAQEARTVGRMVIDSFPYHPIVPEHGNNFFWSPDHFGALSIELFPKQDDVRQDGFGNLMRLPLGRNLKSGKQSFFVKPNRDDTIIEIDDPLEALTQGSWR